jgi:hypothetical protein
MTEELAYFELLKKKIANTFRETYPECSPNMEDWKGQEITNFQEELIAKASGRISEKWFYTHIKTKSEKLPRIDILNLLSAYADFKDWPEFKRLSAEEIQPAPASEKEPVSESNDTTVNQQKEEPKPFDAKRFQKKWLWESLAMVAIFIVIGLFYNGSNKSTKTTTAQTYQFCFIDADSKKEITDQEIDLEILKENESPITKKCDKNGCFEFKAEAGKVKFVVKTPYYRTDTITRNLSKDQPKETIALKTDDYALMIRIFSKSDVKDWKKRRNQLNEMIDDEARILQVKNDENGLEMYNKAEFVNKMTMPLESLKNIEIIETKYTREGKIISIRFSQTEKQ